MNRSRWSRRSEAGRGTRVAAGVAGRSSWRRRASSWFEGLNVDLRGTGRALQGHSARMLSSRAVCSVALAVAFVGLPARDGFASAGKRTPAKVAKPGRAFRERVKPALARGARKAAYGARATGYFALGFAWDGPKHTVQAVRARPVLFSVLLAGVGIAAGGADLAGVDPHLVEAGLIATSVGAATVGAHRSAKEFRAAGRAVPRGDAARARRWRHVGEAAFGYALVPATFGLSKLVPTTGGTEHAAVAPSLAAKLAAAKTAALRAMLLAGENPLLITKALPAKSPKSRRTDRHRKRSP